MPLRGLCTVALGMAATVAGSSSAQLLHSLQQGPPVSHRVSSEAPALPPTEALATLSTPPGYRVELVAAEPLVRDPILIDWDADTRLWVVELPGYMQDMSAPGEYDPTGRIVVLEDTNSDGAMDKRTVFADGLVQPRAVKVIDRGVLVGEPPNIWLFRDADGDLRADGKELIARGYGERETNVEVNANGLYWALDNRIYSAGTGAETYLRFTKGQFQPERTSWRGQWGLSQDDAGVIYRNHNESVLHADLIPTRYFARNPDLVRTRGSHERLIDPDGDINAVWPARETPGTNRAYQHGILRQDRTLAGFTAACAPTVYRGDRLPAELNGNLFVAEPAANLVSRILVYDDGTTFRARKAYDRAEFLTSTDERFRPVYLSSAPDGTLYVVDMYRGVIQHRIYITEYLRDQILARKLERPVGLGRIYRVVHQTTVRDVGPGLSSSSSERLVQMLAHPNGWWRDTAQQLLVKRRDRSATPALVGLFNLADDWRTRLHALWTLDGTDAIDRALVLKALTDRSRDVRAAAVRIAERWLGEPDDGTRTAVLLRTADPDWRVRQQVAASLGAFPAGVREDAVATLLERHGDDPVVLDAALSGLRGAEALVLERMLGSSGERTTAREAAMTMLAATLVRRGVEGELDKLFMWASEDLRAVWQLSALLHGAEIVLLGAPPPGPAAPQGRPRSATAAVPCPTCPGGRAGPGGAYAFRKPEDGQRANSTSGGRRGPILRLAREPRVLSMRAQGDDELATRIRSILSSVVWPGKPGDPVTARALSADEQRRFESGREVYRNICQACHQADGRGQDRLASSLIGSPLALARADITARILLNGKEGRIGLMPPLGLSLTDEQIANVLTYIRREWGHTGQPVTAAEVKAARSLTADRTRPWTDNELMVLLADGGIQRNQN